MVNNDNLEAVRNKIIEANPEIIELKAGCLIRPKNEYGMEKLYKFKWDDANGEHDHFPLEVLYYVEDSESYEERELIEGELVVGFNDPFGHYITRSDARDWLGLDDIEEDIEIIGRRIGLADVLIAIEESIGESDDVCVVSSVGNIGVFDYSILPETNFFDYYKQNINWNLKSDDLSLQSPETIEFLHGLLCR